MRFDRLTLLFLCGTLIAAPASAQELPTLPNVVSGVVDVTTTGPGAMTVTTGNAAIINWNTFSLGEGGVLNFAQPNADAVVLNRVTGDTRSLIAGRITGVGQVFVVNPNGIAITNTGVVNTAGFTASTLGISDDDFLAGNYTFEGDGSSATVSNDGRVEVDSGGYVALLGGHVRNTGSIIAPLGKIGLGAAELITLDLGGDGFLKVAVPSQPDGDEPLISNSGLISSDGGYVQMSVAAAQNATRNVINLSGTVEARSFRGRSGAILLSGDGGLVTVTGKVDTSTTDAPPPRPKVQLVPIPAPRPSFRGGDITISGNAIKLADADIDASGFEGGGNINIGGDYRGNGLVPPATVLDVDFLTSIKADALIDGNGGNIVLWSNDTTTYAGNISARGAGADGVGGNVEVSGKEHLHFSGTVDTRADSGRWGSLLLDPRNIVIVANTSDPPIAGDESFDRIDRATIEAALATNADVTIDTNAGVDDLELGIIRVRDNIAWTTTATLRLLAAADIDLPLAGGDINGGTTGNIVLNAGRDILGNRSLVGANLTATAGRDAYFNLINMAGSTAINATRDVGFGFNIASVLGLRVTTNGNIVSASDNTGITATNGDIILDAGGLVSLGGTTISAPLGEFRATGANIQILSDINANAINLLSSGDVGLFVDNPTDITRQANLTAGTILVQAPGTLTLQATTSLTATAGDIVVNAGRFVNEAGAAALGAQAGRYIVYTADYAADTRGGLAGINLYNRTFANSPPGTTAPGQNAFVYARQPVVTFTIADAMRMYFGQLTGTPAVTFAGLVNGDTIDYATDGDYTAVTDLTAVDAEVGTYANALQPLNITSGVGYAIQFVGGALTVTPAPLTIIANNFTKVYGDTLVFNGTEFTTTGLRGTDSVAGVTLTTPGAAPTARVTGNPYAVVATNATGNRLGNYTISYVPGSLTVTPRALTITAADLQKLFGTTLVFNGTEFTTAGLVNGDVVNLASLMSPGQPSQAPLGAYPISINNATGTGLENYTIGYAPGTLTVGPPPAAVNVQPNYPTPRGNPTLIGLVNPFPDVVPGQLGPEIPAPDARVTLQSVERISQQFAAAIAECERQLQAGGDEGAYLTCASDALEAYADDLDNPLVKLPPELKAAVTVIRQTAAKVRAAAANPNRRAAVAEARVAVGQMVDFVRQQTALVRAVDPDTQALLQQSGQVMTQALKSLDVQLVSAVEI